MFRGRFVHTIDAKGRMSIPAGFRTEMQNRSENPPILTNLMACLALYPHEDWLEVEKRLAEASQLQPEVQSIQRFLVSGAVECPVDGQGRIIIPQYLREHASLERDVTIAGVGPRIELWDKTRFDQDLATTQDRYHEISSVVAGLGL